MKKSRQPRRLVFATGLKPLESPFRATTNLYEDPRTAPPRKDNPPAALFRHVRPCLCAMRYSYKPAFSQLQRGVLT